MLNSFHDKNIRFNKPIVSQIHNPSTAAEAREFAMNP